MSAFGDPGEYPQIFQCVNCGKAEGIKYFSQGLHGLLCQDCRQVASDLTYVDESAQYALQYIATAPLGRLYTFTVSEQVRRTLRKIVHTYLQRNTEKRFKSLEILDLMVAGSQDD
ncbi:MAG: DNA repair protein RecO C-terminal domain-containing protein [Blautia sp.]